MEFNTTQLKFLFQQWALIMQQQKERLIDLDSVVGDGDLGLTMSDGFCAAYNEIKQSTETDIGQFCYLAGKKMSTAVPSTMGTLMASGLIQIGKTFKGRTTVKYSEWGEFFDAYFKGVQARGKANIGDKTFLDGLYPAVETLKNSNNADWVTLAQAALLSAQQGVEKTKTMVAVHGRAAIRGEDSRPLLDPGAYVAQLLLAGFVSFAKKSNA